MTACTTCGSSGRPTPTTFPATGRLPRRTPGSRRDGHRARAGARRRPRRGTRGLDVTVLYANTVRPFDAAAPPRGAGDPRGGAGRAVAGRHLGARGLRTRCATYPHRLLALGVPRAELRRYGTPADHMPRTGSTPPASAAPSTGSWPLAAVSTHGAAGFRPRPGTHYDVAAPRYSRGDAGVAQLVERLTCNEDVAGSTPVTGSDVLPRQNRVAPCSRAPLLVIRAGASHGERQGLPRTRALAPRDSTASAAPDPLRNREAPRCRRAPGFLGMPASRRAPERRKRSGANVREDSQHRVPRFSAEEQAAMKGAPPT